MIATVSTGNGPRRDLWEAIEAGAYPEWELRLQIFTAEQAEKFSRDVLDAIKIVPEELAPMTPETAQVAFCTAHITPGIAQSMRRMPRVDKRRGKPGKFAEHHSRRMAIPTQGSLSETQARPKCSSSAKVRPGAAAMSAAPGQPHC